jgi:hypothetical protein
MKLCVPVAVWWSAALVFAGGTFGFVALGEQRIAGQAATNERLAAQLTQNTAAVRSRGSLLGERGRLRAGLRRFGANGDSAPLVARFVRDADRVAQGHHTTIASIAAPVSPGTPRERAEPLDTISLAVTVEGRYADVLAVIRGLSALPVPAAIDVVSLARTSQPGSTAVAAALRAELQRVEPAAITDVGARPN